MKVDVVYQSIKPSLEKLTFKQKKNLCNMILGEKAKNLDQKELECLREHLDEALKIIDGIEAGTGGKKSPVKPRKISYAEKLNNYKELIESGKKRTLPKHLRK